MIASSSIAIGRSFLSAATTLGVDQLIDLAATAAQHNPEVATEITLAASEEVLMRCGAQDGLCSTMIRMVERLCQARDLSVIQ